MGDYRAMVPGALVGRRFEIEARAGAGGMGTVYRARDRLSGAPVAVKIVAEDAAPARFVQEARLLCELDHPSVVRYIAHGVSDDGRAYLVMEWLDGEDLAARVARGPLSVPEAVLVIRRAAEALAVAHARGIVHRDVKPANLFLEGGEPGRVKVLDFGIARMRAEGAFEATRLPSTRTGAVLGTVGYMSPEQARGGREVDARTDVFALGCVLYECLTGRPAFAGANAVAVLAKVLLEDAPVLAGAPQALAALVGRALSKDPAQRPRDGAQLARALGALESRAVSAPSSPSTGIADREQRLSSIVLARGIEQTDLSSAFDAAEAEAIALADGALLFAVRGADPPSRAAAIALVLRRAAPRAAIAVATGRVDSAHEGAVGPIIDRAATMLVETAPPEIAVDELSETLLGDRFEIAGDQERRRLLGMRRARSEPRTLLGKRTPFLGRDKELALLDAMLRECAEESAARVALVTAPAGIGKSRLLHELLGRVPDGKRVLVSRGDPLGAGSALGIVRQLLRSAADIRDGDPLAEQHGALRAHLAAYFSGDALERMCEAIGELVGAPPPAPDAALFAAREDVRVLANWFRKAFADWIAAVAEAEPVLAIIEDMHWGDPTSVRYLEEALRANAARPLMVLALARPEVHELFSDPFGSLDLQTIRLPPLTRRASERLVRAVLDSADDATVSHLSQRADGNAFFLEELIRHAAAGGSVALPESVLALAESRVLRLDPEQRGLLRAASVFGEACWPGAVAAVLDDGSDAAPVESKLRRLVGEELLVVRPTSRFSGVSEYAFRHGLLRDVAYAMLTDADRAAGHQRAARWLEASGESEALVLADHWERGGDGQRALPWLITAAERAAEGWQLPAALDLVVRAKRVAATPDVLGRIALVEASCAFGVGDVPRAMAAAKDAYTLLPRGTARSYAASATALATGLALGDFSLAPEIVQELLTSEPAGRPTAAYGGAVNVVVGMLDSLGQLEAADELWARARGLGERHGDPDHGFLGWVAFCRAAMSLRRDVELGVVLANAGEAMRHFEAACDPSGIAFTLYGEGSVMAEVGQHDRARSLLREAAAYFAKNEASLFQTWCALNEGWIACDERRYRDAIAAARRALYTFEHRHARALTAYALVELGEIEEAESILIEALEGIDDVLVTGFVVALVHAARARILLARHRTAEALDAIAVASAKSGLTPAVHSLIDRATVECLLALERTDEARARLRSAIDRLERHRRALPPELAHSYATNVSNNAWLYARARELL